MRPVCSTAPTPDDLDLDSAREVREAIRALLVHNGGGEAPDHSTLDVLAALAGRCLLRPVLLAGGRVEIGPDETAGTAALARAPPHHPRRPTRRHVATTEGLPEPGLPLGLLRPLPCGPGSMVRHGGVRQPDQEPQPPLATLGWPRRRRGRGLPDEPHGPGRCRRQGGDARTRQLRQAQRVGRRNGAGVARRAAAGSRSEGCGPSSCGRRSRGDVWSAGHDIDELPVRGSTRCRSPILSRSSCGRYAATPVPSSPWSTGPSGVARATWC